MQALQSAVKALVAGQASPMGARLQMAAWALQQVPAR